MGDRALCSGSTILRRLCYGPNEREGLMSPTETTENKFDLSTKLLGDLCWSRHWADRSFHWIEQRRQRTLSRMALGLRLLAEHCHWHAHADHDLSRFQLSMDTRSEATIGTWFGCLSLVGAMLCPLLLIALFGGENSAFFGRGSIPIASPMLLPTFRERSPSPLPTTLCTRKKSVTSISIFSVSG